MLLAYNTIIICNARMDYETKRVVLILGGGNGFVLSGMLTEFVDIDSIFVNLLEEADFQGGFE